MTHLRGLARTLGMRTVKLPVEWEPRTAASSLLGLISMIARQGKVIFTKLILI